MIDGQLHRDYVAKSRLNAQKFSALASSFRVLGDDAASRGLWAMHLSLRQTRGMITEATVATVLAPHVAVAARDAMPSVVHLIRDRRPLSVLGPEETAARCVLWVLAVAWSRESGWPEDFGA